MPPQNPHSVHLVSEPGKINVMISYVKIVGEDQKWPNHPQISRISWKVTMLHMGACCNMIKCLVKLSKR